MAIVLSVGGVWLSWKGLGVMAIEMFADQTLS